MPKIWCLTAKKAAREEFPIENGKLALAGNTFEWEKCRQSGAPRPLPASFHTNCSKLEQSEAGQARQVCQLRQMTALRNPPAARARVDANPCTPRARLVSAANSARPRVVAQLLQHLRTKQSEPPPAGRRQETE